ncbi:purine permease [Oribacterium sp. oral taxon 102]|uniref:uracil-xanthine permease family protein n=1 Tax=Oribacterium sp. oral taxon 102 TaxID=671214 RepID=UPI0015BE3CA5|nr:nucleobase:cation symporter-2 family protein [Oribacterium sp. oral taxon 102]NWO22076.1 purine permease [Oribacterium sp. oral taxon 102]
METKDRDRMEELFQWKGNPPLGSTISLALQHLVAMIIGCVTPAIIISNVAGLDISQRILLIQASLVMSAVSTLFQLFPIGRRFGAGLPVIMGISFAYLPSMQAIVGEEGGTLGVATITGALMVGGIVAIIVGIFVKKIRHFFPPIITGTVVFTIGLSLYPTAVNYMAGGAANTYELVVEKKGLTAALVYGSWQNWLVAIITLVAVLLFNNLGKGVCKLASILLGMTVGYLVALCFGMISFTEIGTASWLSLPRFLPFGVHFNLAACISIGLLFAINSIQAIGDFTSTTIGGFDRYPTDQELQSGIVAYGGLNFLTAFFGGLPTATYSQNVGIIINNKVVNRKVFTTTAIMILLCGICPKFSAILTTIPQCVLGGATVTVFSSIAMTGMKLITTEYLTPRNTTVVGLSAALGVGIAQASGTLSQFPAGFTMIFGKSPVVVATIMAVILNIILPPDEKPVAMPAEEAEE